VAGPTVDRAKLRARIRKLPKDDIYRLLDRAIDLIAPSKMPKLLEGYFHPEALHADGSPAQSLLEDVKAFHAASLSGEYYEDFDVNSKNFMQKSRGTEAFVAD